MTDVGLDQALEWLDAHTNLEAGGRLRAPGLERISALVDLLGRPQADYPIIHVTGTNGKTTTTRMIAHLLTARRLSVGAYTSPHLERVNERIAWAGEPVADDVLAAALNVVAAAEASLAGVSGGTPGPSGISGGTPGPPGVSGGTPGPPGISGDSAGPGRPSYFEILTAAAYRIFADVAVDMAAVEVGLGGTWDATNVADGTVAVVTNVSLDHTEYLGPTRSSIAAEKAGIVKPGATLVLGETDPELEPLFLERGPERVLRRDVDFGVVGNRPAHGGRVVDLHTPGAEFRELYLPLHGAFQADNAAVALAAAEAFFDAPLDAEVVQEAFASFRSPGRVEVAGHQPLIVLDGAHNVAGARALRATLAEEFTPGPRTLVVGLLREKDPMLMLEALGAVEAARVVACRPSSARALDPRALAAAALELGVDGDRIETADTVAEGFARGLAVTPPEGQLVVAGSLYVVGEAKAALG